MAVERAILKTSSLAKLLTGSERRDIRPFGYMRSEGMVYFLLLKTESLDNAILAF